MDKSVCQIDTLLRFGHVQPATQICAVNSRAQTELDTVRSFLLALCSVFLVFNLFFYIYIYKICSSGYVCVYALQKFDSPHAFVCI